LGAFLSAIVRSFLQEEIDDHDYFILLPEFFKEKLLRSKNCRRIGTIKDKNIFLKLISDWLLIIISSAIIFMIYVYMCSSWLNL